MPVSKYVYLNQDGDQIHYLLTGSGPKVMIGFHGYGLDAASLQVLADALAPGYTFVSIDFPHHGESRWSGRSIPRKELVSIVKSIVSGLGASRFSLAGYSLGGRICMTIVEEVPELVDELVLIAPDGLVFNWAYYLATRNFAGRQLFGSILKNPSAFFKLSDWLVRKKLLSNSKHKFITQYLETRAAREMLQRVWHGTRQLVPELKDLKQKITAYRIPVYLYMGKFDSVIPVEHGHRFCRGLSNIRFEVLQKGHKILDTQTATLIAAQLLKS